MVILSSFSAQGIVAERDDNCCPAFYVKLCRTNLSSWVVALQFLSKFLLASFLWEVFYVYLWSFYWLCVSLRFSFQGFRPHGNASNKKCAKITSLFSCLWFFFAQGFFRRHPMCTSSFFFLIVVFLCDFPSKLPNIFSSVCLRHDTWRRLPQTVGFWNCFNTWNVALSGSGSACFLVTSAVWAFKVCPWPITFAWKTMEKGKQEQNTI